MLVRPEPMRSRLLERDGAIHARIPSHRSMAIAFLGGLVAALWLSATVFWIASLVRPPEGPYAREGPPLSVQLPFLACWIVAECVCTYFWVWNVFRREEVRIDGRTISVRRWPFGRRREYEAAHIRRLRASPNEPSIFRDPFRALFGGALAFDYGARTVRLGNGIDEAEARLIVDSIRTRFPELEL
jgi:hypothetical protein